MASIRTSALLKFNNPNTDGKIFLGVIDSSVHEERVANGILTDRYAVGGEPIGIKDDRHMVTIAGSRAGKGRAAIIPNLIHYPGSVLIIDPKGENAKKTAHRRRAVPIGQRVHVLDPFNASGVRTASSFNPLRILRRGSPTLVEDAGLIADALVVPSGTNSVHWDESARQFIETLVLHVATSTDKTYDGHRDLLKVKELADNAIDEALQKTLTNSEETAVAVGATSFYDRHPEELSSVLSTLRRHLHFLSYKQMRNVLSEANSIDLGDLKRTKMSIYLVLPAMRMGTCSRWLRLFVNLTLAEMEDLDTREKIELDHQVLMCLDEFAVLGNMKTIEDAAGQIAGLGVKLWPILQDLGQLKALYKDRWETFLGNAGVLQFFGNSDTATLEWISQRLGQTGVLNESTSSVTHAQRTTQGAKGESRSDGLSPLISGEEASRFFGRDDKYLRQLIIRASHKPMVLQRAYHDRHPLFKEKKRV